MLLRLCGWELEGRFPDENKMVVVVAPHTSNWDFFIGIACVWALGIRLSFMVKANLFRGPVGGLLMSLGGVPIDRSATHGVVDQMVVRFEESDAWILAITPEGTRKKVESWKTGFYHIAERAKVPMHLVYLDYGRRVVGFGPLVRATEDMYGDVSQMWEFFRQFRAKHPELA